MRKIQTGCCALCQLDQVNDDTPIAHIEYQLGVLKRQKDANVEVGVTTGNGQTAVFTIVSPQENILRENLKTLGFKNVHQFERRKGYPAVGELEMYVKNL